jgi:hypothetical protein
MKHLNCRKLIKAKYSWEGFRVAILTNLFVTTLEDALKRFFQNSRARAVWTGGMTVSLQISAPGCCTGTPFRHSTNTMAARRNQ